MLDDDVWSNEIKHRKNLFLLSFGPEKKQWNSIKSESYVYHMRPFPDWTPSSSYNNIYPISTL